MYLCSPHAGVRFLSLQYAITSIYRHSRHKSWQGPLFHFCFGRYRYICPHPRKPGFGKRAMNIMALSASDAFYVGDAIALGDGEGIVWFSWEYAISSNRNTISRFFVFSKRTSGVVTSLGWLNAKLRGKTDCYDPRIFQKCIILYHSSDHLMPVLPFVLNRIWWENNKDSKLATIRCPHQQCIPREIQSSQTNPPLSIPWPRNNPQIGQHYQRRNCCILPEGNPGWLQGISC